MIVYDRTGNTSLRGRDPYVDIMGLGMPVRAPIGEQDVFMLWSRFATKIRNGVTVRIGQLVSNTPEYPFLPKFGQYVTLIPWTGQKPGELIYLPLESFKKEYSLLSEEEEKAFLKTTPGPPPKVPSTMEKFHQDILQGFARAQDAATLAKLGSERDLRLANTRLASPWSGARALRDAARIKLKSFEDAGYIDRDAGLKMDRDVIQPLTDVINEAQRAISEKSGFIKAFNFVTEVGKRTVVQLGLLIGDEWEKALKLYASFYRAMMSLDPVIQSLEANIAAGGPKVEELKKTLKGVKGFREKLRFANAKIEQQITSVGMKLSKFREEAGLGFEPFTIILIAILFTIVSAIYMIITQTIKYFSDPTYIPHDDIVTLLVGRQELLHRQALAEAELYDDPRSKQAKLYKRLADEATRVIDISSGTFDGFMDRAKDAYPDVAPQIDNYKQNAQAIQEGKTPEEVEEEKKTKPWIYVGAAAGAVGLIAAIYFLFLRK